MSLPTETLATLAKINASLKNLTKALKEFSTISMDESSSRPPLQEAEIYMASLYATTALAAINEKLQGFDASKNDELQVGIKRAQKLDQKLKEQRDKNLRPRLNKAAVQASIKSALVGVNQMDSTNNNNKNSTDMKKNKENAGEKEEKMDVE